MDFGIVHAKIDEIGYITHAENLGYSHCWVTDSQMIDHPIPVYVAGFGPKAQALAGELGDGLISGLPRGGTVPEMLANVRRGAEKAGRVVPAGFHTAAMVNVALLQPGEAANSDRVIAECGAAVISGLHYLVAHHLETGAEPPAYARPVWKSYLDWLDQAPPEVRHQRLHASHYSFVDPEEARFLTPEVIEATSLTGPPERIVERLKELEGQGLSQIMLYPPLNRQYRVIEDFADRVMARM
jgi:alkanesulfonate monooxygenase SsuD/methylene tetrahydromethanopterin reductase-like flavin-dependent oxidoreductase (luciferase family)